METVCSSGTCLDASVSCSSNRVARVRLPTAIASAATDAYEAEGTALSFGRRVARSASSEWDLSVFPRVYFRK